MTDIFMNMAFIGIIITSAVNAAIFATFLLRDIPRPRKRFAFVKRDPAPRQDFKSSEEYSTYLFYFHRDEDYRWGQSVQSQFNAVWFKWFGQTFFFFFVVLGSLWIVADLTIRMLAK